MDDSAGHTATGRWRRGIACRNSCEWPMSRMSRRAGVDSVVSAAARSPSGERARPSTPSRTDALTCPAHGWQFDLTTGNALNRAPGGLRRYRVQILAGQVWIELP
jgi:hypothetical protein